MIGSTVAFAQSRARWGLAWSSNIPVFAMAIILIGGIQHRLAGLGHEASHYCFMKDRLLNDLIPDLFCMFPLLTTVHFYRLFHRDVYQHSNADAGRLTNSRGFFTDPFTRWSVFVYGQDMHIPHPRSLSTSY